MCVELRWFFFYQPSCANQSCISQGYITGDHLPRYQLHISPRNKTVIRHFFYISPIFLWIPYKILKIHRNIHKKSRAFIHFGGTIRSWGVSQPTRQPAHGGGNAKRWMRRRCYRRANLPGWNTRFTPQPKTKKKPSDGWKIARFFSRENTYIFKWYEKVGRISIVRVDLFVKGQHDKWARFFRWGPFHSTEIRGYKRSVGVIILFNLSIWEMNKTQLVGKFGLVNSFYHLLRAHMFPLSNGVRYNTTPDPYNLCRFLAKYFGKATSFQM